jgi:hypothetical protein
MKILPACLLGCAAACVATACIAADGMADPVYTNRPRFRIPFRYDAAEMRTLGAREIQLYVSTDQGAQWQIAGRANPDQGRFEYEAPSDGEYWFAVRTVDVNNQVHPNGDFQPGLKVTVDTTQPSLELILTQTAAGQIDLTWNIDDPNVDLSSIQIETRQAGASEWRRIPGTNQASGSTTWTVGNGGIVAVKGTVRDLAKNSATTESQLRIVSTDEQLPQPSGPDLSGPIARNTSSHGNGGPMISPRGGNGRYIADQKENRPDVLQPRYPQPQQTEPVPQRERAPAADNRARLVNSTSFQIGYQVDDVGPSGVSSIDLFITPDDGKKWYRYGSDPDNTSPFRVEVPRDGIYGFALRVRSGVGLVAAPPRPGDKPPIVVIVDTSPPVVELMPAEQGPGEDLNKIVINWNITDANPATKSVAVYYSRGPQGPWESITGWQEDNGGYSWMLGQNMPPKFYVRVAARDAAGNVTEVDAETPVVVDLTRPRARIVDVESSDAH